LFGVALANNGVLARFDGRGFPPLRRDPLQQAEIKQHDGSLSRYLSEPIPVKPD